MMPERLGIGSGKSVRGVAPEGVFSSRCHANNAACIGGEKLI